jgi:hypothetical protein
MWNKAWNKQDELKRSLKVLGGLFKIKLCTLKTLKALKIKALSKKLEVSSGFEPLWKLLQSSA